MNEKNATREKLLDITFEEIYIHGYAATSVGSILAKAQVPKGSMYHFFDSKKSLVLAMIQERLYPKMDLFFNYEKQDDLSVFQSLKATFAFMAKNKPLIINGCPLYRLMVELSPVDKDFDALLVKKYEDMQTKLEQLLHVGIKTKEFKDTLSPKDFSSFLITSVWGILSLSPSVSSPRLFLSSIKQLLSLLALHKAS